MARRRRKRFLPKIRFKKKFPFVSLEGARKKLDIEFHKQGMSLISICPVTVKGKRWAKRNIADTPRGGCYVAETRYAWDIAQGAVASKLKIGP